MAVKPITNNQVVNSTSVRREEHRSLKNQKLRGGNESRTYVPGLIDILRLP